MTSIIEVQQSKDKLEAELKGKIAELLEETMRRNSLAIRRQGFPDVNNGQFNDYFDVLYEHAKRSQSLTAKIEDVEAFDEYDRQELAILLSTIAQQQASYFTNVILDTNRRQIISSHAEALQVIKEEDQDQSALPVIAGALLLRRFKPRPRIISVTTTQNYVENARHEINVKRYNYKTWSAKLDERTRIAHIDANGQKVPVDGVFIVQNEQLRYPGDNGLGASLNNIIGCRCDAIYE